MARYVGGPCNGLSLDDSFTEPRVCGGVLYARGSDGNYRPDTSSSSGGGTSALGSHAPKGWHDLQTAVNHRLPTAISHAQRLRRATAHRLARQRRLG